MGDAGGGSGLFDVDDVLGQAREAYEAALARVDNVEYVYALEALQQARAGIDLVIWRAVQLARRDGETWQAIGDALGMTRQAAQQRFHRA